MQAKRSVLDLMSSRLFAIARTVGLPVVIGILVFWLTGSVLIGLELAAGDVLFKLRGAQPEKGSHVVIVAIDDASFTQNGLQWPWPRDYIAKIVDGVAAGNPRAVAIDVLFYEASALDSATDLAFALEGAAADDPTVEQALESMSEKIPALAQTLEGAVDRDAILARSLQDAGNIVLVNNITTQVQGNAVLRQLNRPLPVLDEAAASVGLTNFPRDADGTVRRLLAFQSHQDQLLFSWAMQVARLYLGESDFDVWSRDLVFIGDHAVQLEGQYLIVNYSGPAGIIPYVSAYQVADGIADPQIFNDKIVLIGATSESLHDSYPTPFGSQPPMPGVEINAHAIDTLLTQQFVQPVGDMGRLVLATVAAFIGIGLALRLRPLTGLGAVVVLVVVYALAAAVLFIQIRMTLPIVAPLLSIGLTYVAGTSIQLYVERAKRAQVRALFDRYVAPAAIDEMLSQPESYALSGQRREMTILFSDIRGFTSLSEQLSPDEVVKILNEYLGVMTDLIFKHEGTVDKFEGDAILAIWNAPLPVPDHANKAVQCAIEMAQTLSEMQKQWEATGHLVLRNGIGINTGTCFVGNIGSAQRMDYTVIGDTVNLAARLEALTKEVGVQVLFTEATVEQLDPELRPRFVTSATVKGRVKPVNVYTVDPQLHGLAVDEGVDLGAVPASLTQTRKD